MWFTEEWDEQTIDRLLQELGIRLPQVELADDNALEHFPDLEIDRDINLQQPEKFNDSSASKTPFFS